MSTFPELPLGDAQNRNATLLDTINELESRVTELSDSLETALLWIELVSSAADSDARGFIQECQELLRG